MHRHLLQVILISMLWMTIWSASKSSIKIAIIVDYNHRSSFSQKPNLVSTSSPKLDSEYVRNLFNSTELDEIRFNVEYFDMMEEFINETKRDCSYSFVLTMTDCRQNYLLYKHLRLHCYEQTILFSFFELACQRPPSDIGFGIPNTKSINNILPLLYDIGFVLIKSLQEIVILYDDETLDLQDFHEFFKKNQFKQTIEYKLEDEKMTSNELTRLNKEIIENLHSSHNCFIIVVCRSMIMEKIVRTLPRATSIVTNRWTFILTDPITIDPLNLSFETRNILSISDVFLIYRKTNTHNECNLYGFHNLIEKNVISAIKESVRTTHLEANRSNTDCDSFVFKSFFKHRTNDFIDKNKGVIQINHPNVEYRIMTQTHGTWNVFKGLIVDGLDDQMMLILKIVPSILVSSMIGMIDKVRFGEIVIGANGYWKTEERMKVIDYTAPFDMEKISIIIKKSDEDHRYLFLAPFTSDAWFCLLITVILMGPSLWFVHHSSRYYEYYNLKNEKGLFKLSNCIWYCYGAMVQQGGDYLPMAVSGRILVAFWWIFVIVTVTTYSGNLVALLTFPKLFNSIDNLDDLLNHKHLVKYGAFRFKGIGEMIIDSFDSRLRMLGDNLYFFDHFDRKMVLNMIKQSKLVLLASHEEIKHLISEDYKQSKSCHFAIAREPITSRAISFIVKKNTPKAFLDKLNSEINRMAKSGLVTLWNRKFGVLGNDCLHPLIIRTGDVEKIGLSHMVDCFFVLGCGLVIAIIILVIEILKEKQKPLNLSKDSTLDSVSALSATMFSSKLIRERIRDWFSKLSNAFQNGFYSNCDKRIQHQNQNHHHQNNQRKLHHQLAFHPTGAQPSPQLNRPVYFTYTNGNGNYYNNILADNEIRNLHELAKNHVTASSTPAKTATTSSYKKEWNKAFRRQQKLYYFQKNIDSPRNHLSLGSNTTRKHY
ncbi:Glutamate receptor [Sarcoptes scabiei]|uniref:Glutamate receptor n=1 Tax=Sarcoptes scabiei TaxID=52283 RepID=A0A834R4Q3_SARSC|nr:Glutamate receptor [Sarcoptes scabiei]